MYGVLKNNEFAFLAELRFFGRHVTHESRPKDPLFPKIKNTIFIKKKPVKIDKREFLSIKKQNNFKTYYLNGYEILSAKIIENTRYIKKNKNYFF